MNARYDFRNHLSLMLALLIPILIVPPHAHAHRVTVFAWTEGDTVHTESKFSGGKLVTGGKITVYDDQEKIILSGITDEKGLFSFPAPQNTALRIELEAGTGHKNHWIMGIADLGTDTAPSEHAPAKQQPPEAKTVEPLPENHRHEPLTPTDIEQIVGTTLDKKLAPLMKMMAAAQDKGPTVRDVFGGIGYILGLVGLAAYVNYRKKSLGPPKK
jgi:nickel transport protein